VPKAVVVGTGVIGTIYAAILREQGWNISHLVRQGTVSAKPSLVYLDLLDLRKGCKRHSKRSYEYHLVETVPDDAEVVLIPVRLYQLDDVLKDLAGKLERATAVIFTTNWAGLQPIDDALANDNYVLADAIAGGAISGNTLTATVKPILPLGAVHPTAETRADAVRKVFSDAGLAPKHEHDILHWHWLQYALNAAMWPALIEAGSARGVVKNRELLRRMMMAGSEAVRVCEARGVAVDEYPESRVFLNEGSGVKSRVSTWIMREAYGFVVVHSEYNRRCMLHALSDPREIAVAYSSVLATGKGLDCDMPAFDSFKGTVARFQRAQR
jgi:ketopantoate reductase